MAGHKLLRLTQKIYNTPHLMVPASLENAINYLRSRNDGGGIELAIQGGSKRSKDDVTYNPDTGMGVICIDGPLTYIEYQGLCGESNASYQQIKEEFDTMLSLGASTIVLDVDSPGGEAYGCFETASYLRSKADENNVKLIGYVDGMAASAAYGLLCACHEVIVNPMAEAGSIGVVVQLMNVSKLEKNMGVERQYVYAGDSKVPFDNEGNFTESFLADIQDRVDSLYQEFIGHVAEMRSLSMDSVQQTQAKVFSASKSIELGLADQVMTREEFFEYLSEVVEKGKTMSLKSYLFKAQTNEDTTEDMVKLKELESALSEMTQNFSESQIQLSAVQAQLSEAIAALSTQESLVAELKASQERAELAAQELKVAARKEKLSAVLSADKVDPMLASLSVLDDAAFGEVVSSFANAQSVVDESILMKEVGVSGEGNAPKQEEAGLALVGELIKKSKKQ
ncbi:putative protease SohB [compost metagenome]